MANDIVQTITDARIDARALSEFMFKPASYMVARRLAPPVHTLNYYLNLFDTVAADGAAQLAQAAINQGFITIDSFELGATITQRNQALRHTATGRLYRWAGDLPKAVPANSTPTSSGGTGDNAWLEVSDVTLRQDLANAQHKLRTRIVSEVSSHVTAEADRAESARDAAFVNADVYPDIATGLAAVADGEQFQVVLGDEVVRYRNSGDVDGIEVARYPSASVFSDLDALISSEVAEPLLSFKDSEGAEYALFNSAGELILSGLDSSVQSSLQQEAEKTADLIEKTAGLIDSDFGEYALTHEFRDSEGYTVLALDSNGSLLLQGLGGKGLQQCIHELQQDSQDSQDKQDEAAGFTVIVEPEPITPIVTEPPTVRLDETHNTPRIQGVPSGARTGSRSWACWYSNDLITGEGGGDYVNVAYSDDNWDTSVEYAHIAYDDPTLRVFDPQIWTDPRGFLWVLVGVGGNNVISDGLQGTWAFTVKNPEAEIPNFSAAMLVSKIGIPMNPKTINEQIYLPIDNWLGSNSQFPELPASRIFALDYLDRKAQRIIDLPASQPATKYVETNIAQLSNGDIIGVVRTPGSAQITKSTDNGKTWSQFEPWLALGANPSTRLWVGATPSGRLLVAYNNAEDRSNLTIGLSEDGGETLSHKLLVDSRAGVTYPTVYFDDVGNIHVVYDRSRGVAKEINVAIVNEAELITGTATPIIKIISTK